MAIKIASNFGYKGPLPNFERDVVETMEELLSTILSGNYAEGSIVYCKADKKPYVLSTNESGELVPGPIGTGESQDSKVMILTQSEYDALSDKEEILYIIKG